MKRILFRALAFVGALTVGTQLWAAPPANDNLANAQVLAGDSGNVACDTTESTQEAVDIGLADYPDSQHTVWYKWTATKTGFVNFSTLGSDFDTVIAAYLDINSSAVAFSDDYYGDSTSRIEFFVQAGQTYLIRVGGYYSSSGALALSWTLAEVEVQELTGDSGEKNIAVETPEYARTLYYSWTVQKTGPVHFDLRADGSDYETEFTVSTISGMVSDGYDDIDFFAEAGQTYLIRARVFDYVENCKALTVKWSFADVQELSDEFGVATVQSPNVAEENAEKVSVWYKWTPKNTGPAYFDTYASDFDTSRLAAYTNSVLVALDSEWIEFCAQAGQTYFICVKFWNDEPGKMVLRWQRDLAEGEWKIFAADGIVISAVGDLPMDLTAADFPSGVTNIAASAFQGMDDVRFVTIPATVTKIGRRAFAGMSDLAWVDYEGDTNAMEIADTAFLNTPYCAELPFKLILDNGVSTNTYRNAGGTLITNIEEYCAVEGFVGTLPEELVIPEGVTCVRGDAFHKMNDVLRKVTFPSTLKSTEWVDYRGRNYVRYAIEDWAFSDCDALEEVVGIPTNAKVSNWAFAYTPYEENRPFELATRDRYDFVGWDYERGVYTNVTKDTWVVGFHGSCPGDLVIPDGVYGIDDYVFAFSFDPDDDYGDSRSVTNINKVTLPASIQRVDSYAFFALPNLTDVVFGGDKTKVTIDSTAFVGTPYWPNAFEFLKRYDITEYKLDGEGNYVYDENWNRIPVSSNLWITGYIGKAPEKLVIPDGVYGIQSRALAGLDGVTEVTIPASVKEIGYRAFADCEDLATVTILGKESEMNISDYAFLGTPYCAKLDFKLLADYKKNDGYSMNFYDENGVPTNTVWVAQTNWYVYGYVGKCPEKLDLTQHLTNRFDSVLFQSAKIFADIDALKELVLPEAAYSDSGTFRDCTNLTTVSISGDNATDKAWLTRNFQGTPYLDTVIPNFELVTESLVQTNYPPVVTNVNCCTTYEEMSAVATNEFTTKVVVGFYGNVPANLMLTNEVDEIGGSVFADCDNITNVVVAGTITSVGAYAFEYCDNLERVEFEEGVQDLGYGLFYGGSTNLLVVLPTSVVMQYDEQNDDWVSRGFGYTSVFAGINGDVDVLAPRCTSIYDKAFYSGGYFGRTCVEYYTRVILNGNGGTFEGDADYRCFDDVVSGLPTPVRAGYAFREWWDKDRRFYRNDDVWGEDDALVSLKAEWAAERRYNVYGLNGPVEIILGEGDTYETLLRVLGEAYGTEPQPSRHGLTFNYWTVDGVKLNHRSVIGPNSVFAADFERFNPLSDDPDAKVNTSAMQTYDGYVLDDKENEIGTIQVSVGKPNKKSGEANVSAKVQLLGKAKLTFKASPKGKWKIATSGATTGVTLFSAKSSDKIVIDISEKGIFGTFGAYTIIGSRNTSKKDTAYNKWSGKTYSVVFSTKEGTGSAFTKGYSAVTVSIAKKGKVKITGVMADGTKVNASTQLLISDKGEGCVNAFLPMYTGKKGGFGFVLWIDPDSTTTYVESVSTWKSNAKKNSFTAELEALGAAVPAPASSMEFSLDEEPEISGATVLTEYLPPDVKVSYAKKKLVVAKANMVKLDKSGTPVSTGKTDNDAGLRLTYTAKTGAFKGSFSVYTLISTKAKKQKLKKYTATVNGVFAGDEGYGSAVIKGVGSFPITLH